MSRSDEEDQIRESSADEESEEEEIEEKEAQSESIDESNLSSAYFASSNTSYNKLLIKSRQEDNMMTSYFKGGKDDVNMEL